MKAKVYGAPGSHPVKAAMLMLEHKGIDAKRTDLPPMAVKPLLRAMGYPGVTVPAVKLDGRKVQTTRALARELDELKPDPPLFPADPEQRAKVEEAERWADEELQPIPRRFSYSGPVRRRRSDLATFFDGPLLGLPPRAAAAIGGPLLAIGARVNKADDDAVRADIDQLPRALDRIDKLLADGVIGGLQPNAADFQIASTVRLLMCFDDLRPAIERRPAGRFATDLVPDYSGHMPPVAPAEWLAHLR